MHDDVTSLHDDCNSLLAVQKSTSYNLDTHETEAELHGHTEVSCAVLTVDMSPLGCWNMRGQPAQCTFGNSASGERLATLPGSDPASGPKSGVACGSEGASAAFQEIPRSLAAWTPSSFAIISWLGVVVRHLGVRVFGCQRVAPGIFNQPSDLGFVSGRLGKKARLRDSLGHIRA